MTDLLEVARHYCAAGLSVIPIKPDGSKAPALGAWKDFQSRRPTDEELVRWFENTPLGIAVVCGAISGNLAVMDFETAEVFDQWCEQVGDLGLEALNGDPIAKPPNGGRHIYLRLATPITCTKMARDKTGKTRIEVKGEGGYVLAPGCPGTCHPTGRPYEWVQQGWIQ